MLMYETSYRWSAESNLFRLFVVYLIVLLFVAAFRSLRSLYRLRKLELDLHHKAVEQDKVRDTSYRFGLCRIDVQWLKSVVKLNLLLSVFSATYGFFPTLGLRFNNTNVDWVTARLQTWEIIVNRASMGLFVSCVMLTLAIYVELRLAALRLRWEHLFQSEAVPKPVCD
jgi:hypothetical protein